VSGGHRILEKYLTIDNATYESVNLREYHCSVLLILLSMLDVLLVCREIHASKLGLNYETPLVRWKSYVNFDGIFNTIRIVDLLEKLLLTTSKANVVELFGSGQSG